VRCCCSPLMCSTSGAGSAAFLCSSKSMLLDPCCSTPVRAPDTMSQTRPWRAARGISRTDPRSEQLESRASSAEVAGNTTDERSILHLSSAFLECEP
jgi:hypothetical protein